MDRSINWSENALTDIENIAEHIGRDSIFYAKQVVAKIKEKSESLKHYPERGRVVPEFRNPLIREVFVYSYRVIYQIAGQNVEILTVIHGRKLLDL